jgi:TolB protein
MRKMLICLGFVSALFSQSVNAGQQSIAYLAHTDGFWQVWIMDSDGGNKKQVTSSAYDKSHISWFPDGRHLLVNGNQGRVSRVDVENSNDHEIHLPIKGTVDAKISPDGTQITFSLSVADSIDNNHIWLTSSEGKKLIKLTNMSGLQHEPVWSPDGEYIYFLSGKGKQAHDIWRISISGKRKEQVTAGQLYNFDLAFSPRGEMAFSNNRTGNYEIWLRDLDSNERQFTHNDAIDSRPSWSLDARYIVFESSRGGVMNIWKKSIDTDETKRLTNELIGARFPVWAKN